MNDCEYGRFRKFPFLTVIKMRAIAEMKGIIRNMRKSNVSDI